MKKVQTYWVCQLMGWFGMVAIEMVNYTFFIAGKFSLPLLWGFVRYAIAGIIITHLFRMILSRRHFFSKATISIWLIAFASTLVMSVMLMSLSIIPSVFDKDFSAQLKQLTLTYTLGMVINWMRYVGVWVIIYFMYKVLEQNSLIQREKLMIENLAKTTELELLKTQLNPHFLFNALNSIKALVIINPETCRDAIVKLSELLRFTLQYGKETTIAAADELKEVKKYLELEQLRFGSRLKVTYYTDAEALHYQLPPAIILTLAENAVKHGVAKLASDSHIEIKLGADEKKLVVTVKNNGNYLPPNTEGIGLKHVKKRLEEIFQNRASFTIAQQDNDVVATIQILTT